MISRAENEVDSLEIVVEAEANKANRAMTSLEKKINKVAESLERCMLIAQGSVSLKGIDVDKLFAGDAMSKAAKTSGKKLADDLIKNFNLSLAGADVQNQVKSLTNKISKHCKFYSNADMAKITATAMTFVTWHITYFRDLRIYIRSLESKEDVGRITYGTGIPEAYQSEPLKAMLAQKS